jgi:hypothetical protein
MLAETTLIALACLIANKGPIDTSSVEANLTASDRAEMQTIINAGACDPAKVSGLLPESLENLIQKTHDNMRQGSGMMIDGAGGQPTGDCF